jgi:Trypsin
MTAHAQDLSGTQKLGPGFVAAQQKAVASAEKIAQSQHVLGTAQYAASLRQALNRSLPASMLESPQATQELRNHVSVLTKQPAFHGHAVTEIYGGDPVVGPPPTGTNVNGPSPPLAAVVSPFDLDPRYRANLALLTGGQGNDFNRIYGGLPTGGYLNTVAVISGTTICTGTVVAKNAVVTAEHCYCPRVDKSSGLYDGKVFVGYSYVDGVQTSTYKISISRKPIPRRACDAPPSTEADIVLMFTEQDLPANVVPAVLASKATIDQATIVRAVGFGWTQTGILGQKMMVDIPVVSTSCDGSVPTSGNPKSDSAYYGCNPKFELVAADPLLVKDTCNGDSGGPLFIRDSAGNDYLAAATSRAINGTPGGPGCGPGGIYVRLDGNELTWLYNQGLALATPH